MRPVDTNAESVTAKPRGVAEPRSRFKDSLSLFAKNKGSVIAIGILLLLVAAAVLAPVLTPYDPIKMSSVGMKGPSLGHLFGTDRFGRDVLTRVLFGARLSLWVAFIATAIGSVLGVIPGLIAGYRGGWADMMVMRLIDIMLAFPGIILAMAIVAVLGGGLTNVMIAVGISLIPSYVRLVRGTVLSVKENAYIDAARVIGCRDTAIMFRHILPNVIAPIIILMTVSTAWAVIIATSLNFLGLGVQPPMPEWGADLAVGRNYLRSAWWVGAFPGLFIMITLLSINLMGDGLRDALDPRLRQR